LNCHPEEVRESALPILADEGSMLCPGDDSRGKIKDQEQKGKSISQTEYIDPSSGVLRFALDSASSG
jgi:hypothetical protein